MTILAMWAAKGGVGLSVTAAAAAIELARVKGAATLIDLVGDQAAILGVAEPMGEGVNDWLASKVTSVESLQSLATPVTDGLTLIHRGRANDWSTERLAALCEVMDRFDQPVVIDCGLRWVDREETCRCHHCRQQDLVDAVTRSSRSIMVTSGCYVALRHAVGVLAASRFVPPDGTRHDGRQPNGGQPDGLVVVTEPGRALDGRDAEAITQIELLASVTRDPAVARVVDAGLLPLRAPRSLLRSVSGLT